MRFFKYLIIILLMLNAITVFAYKPKRTNSFSSYNEHTNEIGYGINFSYLKYERTFSPQLHLHYSKYMTDFFSVGLSYGGIYDRHFHNNVNMDFTFRLYKQVLFALKPGMAFKKIGGEWKLLYSVGFAANYEIPISNNIHIGPMVEINLLQDDVNYLAGFHMGFSF